jgi:hypothetical protein
MGNSVKIVECPRDAWQGMPALVPAELKADYLRKLIAAGFKHIDAVSFVSPAAVPQMADTEEALALLDPSKDVELIGIVVNGRGAERAIKTGAISTLGFPYSISPEFLRRNQNQTQREALDTLRAICVMARDAGLSLVAYVSMAFGNPYGDDWQIQQVSAACDALAAHVRRLSRWLTRWASLNLTRLQIRWATSSRNLARPRLASICMCGLRERQARFERPTWPGAGVSMRPLAASVDVRSLRMRSSGISRRRH